MTMVAYADLPPDVAPDWGSRARERFEFEVQDLLHFVGDSLRIDAELLRKGTLRITFLWPMRDGTFREIETTFPDTYPFIRPMVRLLGRQSDFPDQHVSPLDGNLCLLGRDSGLWSAQWTLATLLDKQLWNVMKGTGIEDPQAEPVEVWWNTVAHSDAGGAGGSYVLVDSAWNIANAEAGTIDILFKAQRLEDNNILFRGVVSEIRAQDGTVLAISDVQLPSGLQTRAQRAQFPWRRVDKVLPPAIGEHDGHKVWDDVFFNHRPVDTDGPAIALSITVQRTEVACDRIGDAWLFALLHGPKKRFRSPKPGKAGQPPQRAILPTYRAGRDDMGGRVPSVSILREKTITVLGLGAIGAPIVMEFARNGCSKLILLDHDIVEPGNSIRWPLGTSSWGRRKTSALKRHVETEYPETKVQAIDHVVGLPSLVGVGDNAILPDMVRDADLVIDATASTGVSRLLADLCQKAGKIMVSVYGTASLKGGVVAVYHPSSGCPTCREFAYQQGLFNKPPGSGETDTFQQMPGCAELTFTGSSVDLAELSLAAVRAAVAIVSDPKNCRSSSISTLSLHDGEKSILPSWETHELPANPECGCHS